MMNGPIINVSWDCSLYLIKKIIYIELKFNND